MALARTSTSRRPGRTARLGRIAVAISLCVAARPVRAAEPLFAGAPAWTSPAEDTRHVALGDVDGDGVLDLVRASIDQATTLTLGTGGLFATTPRWRGPVEATRAVALGDVDGDGDLDLVRGNTGQGATLYRNVGGSFAATPAWTGQTEVTRAIALGDVDGDGDLDLVQGNVLGGSTLYRNLGGVFETVPAWTGPAVSTNAVALGDVNGDGAIDLVLGNFDTPSDTPEPALLFLNVAGVFAAAPAWTGPPERTRGIALGDVDGDGDFDLVRGNLGAPSTLTLNTGGTFAAAPAWTSAAESTWVVALGDVDGDGALDLVRGNGERGSTLHLGAGGTFAATPAWTGPAEDSRSVALGDVDGDGDLDLVRGNLLQASTLYLNRASPLSVAPVWSAPLDGARAVALGDVDGDGDLDMVRGALGVGTALFPGTPSGPATTPSWTGPNEPTLAMALGDVDGDGDLDLVRGNADQPSTLYRFDGAGFGAAPAWTGPSATTFGVALGDVDGDGDLDLVRGNYEQAATLTRNVGGTFAASPAWTGPVEPTRAVALADLDGDGDVDLVRGNFGAPSTVYWNSGGTFKAGPAWRGPSEATSSVALGDVNGDGVTDLVRGNASQGATLTLGVAGAPFAALPAWTGPVEPTESVALGDLDGDGDLDLVRGNVGQPVTLYLNENGTFPAAPSFTVSTDSTWSIALGDADGDGDLDAALGHLALFANRSPWSAAGASGRALPNNAAHLRGVAVDSIAPNQHRIRFRAVDAESDRLSLLGEYQFAGEPVWRTMTFLGGATTAGPFASAPAGVAHTLMWDVTGVPFDARPVVVRLRSRSAPRRTGLIDCVPAYLRDVGRVTPVRPSLDVAPATLVFPTVTVGDTAEATITIANRGNLDLEVGALMTPAPELTLVAPPDLVVPPGETRAVTARLAPRAALPPLGPIVVPANDPARPEATIAVTTDVRTLEFETQLLAVADALPLGEAATVVVTPAPAVRIESGHVFFRPRGAAAFADSAGLVAQGSNFIALIPSDAVTEAGLEYYVKVENSGVAHVDPPGAPAVVYDHAVAAAATATALPASDERGVFPAGRATPIVVTLPDGARFVDGAVYFRPGGAAAYDSLALAEVEVSPGIVAPVATLPAAAVGPRGVEYWARVRTLAASLTDPPSAPESPRTFRVTVDRLAEPGAHAARYYRLVSVPLDLDLPAASSLDALLSDQAAFGPPDVTRWRAFRWAPSLPGYLEVGVTAGDPRLHPEPGRAYWLVAAEPNAIDTAPVPGRSSPTDAPRRVPIEPGWNQIGDPFVFPVAWSLVTAEGASGPVAIEPPAGWNEAEQRYLHADVDVLRPFEGCWVFNPTSEAVDLLVPPVEVVVTSLPAGAAPGAGGANAGAAGTRAPAAGTRTPSPWRALDGDSIAWRLGIEAACGGHADGRNMVGVDPLALAGRDALDRTDPPASPEGGVTLYFLDPDSPERAPLTADLRAPSAAADPAARGHRWAFDVARPGGEAAAAAARLGFTGLDDLPAGLAVRLLDRALERTIDPRETPAYDFVSTRRARVASAAEARFELIAGTPEYVGAAVGGAAARAWGTRLHATFPNPIVSAATIRYEVERAAPVTLEVFDVGGRRVRELVRAAREAGVHELAWDGRDDRGRALSPGVYTLRLRAAGRADTRTVVKVR